MNLLFPPSSVGGVTKHAGYSSKQTLIDVLAHWLCHKQFTSRFSKQTPRSPESVGINTLYTVPCCCAYSGKARGMFYRKQTTTFIFKVLPYKTMFAPSIWSSESDKIYNIGKFWSLHNFFTLPARHRVPILDCVCFPKVRTGLPARSSWKFCQNCPQKPTTFEHTSKE